MAHHICPRSRLPYEQTRFRASCPGSVIVAVYHPFSSYDCKTHSSLQWSTRIRNPSIVALLGSGVMPGGCWQFIGTVAILVLQCCTQRITWPFNQSIHTISY
jgi:hypothetical protein